MTNNVNSNAGGNKSSGKPDNGHRSISGIVDIRGRVETHLPESFIKDYKENNKSSETRENRRFFVERITLGCVLIVGVFSGIQTCQSVRSTRISNESLISVQRAFVFGTPKTTVEQKNPDILDGVNAFMVWENSGSTPSRDMTDHVNWEKMLGDIPKDFSFPDKWENGEPHESRSWYLPPHSSENSSAEFISLNDLKEVAAGKAQFSCGGGLGTTTFSKPANLTSRDFATG